jgi:lipoyl(octanoyl) transferase
VIQVKYLGRVPYVECWEAMKAFTQTRHDETPDQLWVIEHDPVFTQGQAGRAVHLLDPGSIPVVPTDRGGQVTYHGPGQVVIYTLIDLRRAGYFVRELVYRIEQAVLQVLDSLGVQGRRISGAPGVYVPLETSVASADERFRQMGKIAALGIKVHRGCSYHGVSVNVDMDLGPYDRIDPCGYQGLRTVDLASLGVAVAPAEVASRLVARLQAHLNSSI